MRVGYIVSQYPAPSHTFIRREIEALRARGVDIRILSVRRPKPEEVLSERDAASQRETFYVLPPRPRALLSALGRLAKDRPGRLLSALAGCHRVRNPGARNFVYAFVYWIEAALVADELGRSGIEHLHCHFVNPASQVALAASTIAGVPFSLTLHGMGDFEYPGGTTLAAKLERSSFVASATEYGVAQAMRLSPRAQWEKLCVVRCGIDPEALPEPRPGPEGARPRLVCVSRLSPEKGQIGLLIAFAEARRRGLDADLVLVGDGPDRAVLEAEVARLGLEADVTLLGRKSEQDTLTEVARSDVLVMASFMEGLPVAIMEALALEVPVIAPRITGIPELVEEGVTGCLFTAGKWTELADRMVRLVADPELRRRMGRAGRERILAEFDVHRAVAPLAERFGAPEPGALAEEDSAPGEASSARAAAATLR